MAPQQQPFISSEQYLWDEERAPIRHEYINGQVFAMAGGSDYHNLISLNVGTELNLRLRGSHCRAYPGEMKIGIPPANTFLYPDASVVCGPSQYVPKRNDTITNPVLIVEVLSPSTESRDRNEKFDLYERIPTLKHILLINQFRPRVEHWQRTDNGLWLVRFVTQLEDSVAIESLSIEMPLRFIYDNIIFDLPQI